MMMTLLVIWQGVNTRQKKQSQSKAANIRIPSGPVALFLFILSSTYLTSDFNISGLCVLQISLSFIVKQFFNVFVPFLEYFFFFYFVQSVDEHIFCSVNSFVHICRIHGAHFISSCFLLDHYSLACLHLVLISVFNVL